MKQPDLGFQTILNHYMDQKGMTLYRIAKLTGTSRQAIGRLLAGAYLPRWETAFKLAQAFELGPDETANFMASAGYLAPGYLPVPWEIARAINEVA